LITACNYHITVVNSGPANSDSGMNLASASADSDPDDSRPKLMTSTKRKLAVGISSATAAEGLHFKTGQSYTPSSIKLRLGEPVATVASNSQSRLMITTEGKIADETAPTTAASAMSKLSTKSPIKSRLGEPVSSGSQKRLMISTKRKPVEETVPGGIQLGKLGTKSSIKGRLGEQAVSGAQTGMMISTKRKLAAGTAADDDEEHSRVSAKYSSVFNRLGPSFS